MNRTGMAASLLTGIWTLSVSFEAGADCTAIPVESKGLGYRQLYFEAACGENSAQFAEAQATGSGVMIDLSDELAQQLAGAAGLSGGGSTGTIRRVYVRGGGPDKPMLLFFLRDGWAEGVVWEGGGEWTGSRASAVLHSLNRTPYELLRKVATRLLVFVAKEDDLLWTANVAGVAYGPLHSIFLTHDALDAFTVTAKSLDSLVLHEVSHYLQYYYDGFYGAMCWAGPFGSITWRNRRLFGIDLPCLFKKKNGDPASYVTDYAMYRPAEDFAETAIYALKSTQRLITDFFWTENGGTEVEVDAHVLFSSANQYLRAKGSYMTQKTTYGFSMVPGLQQDGDADGFKWVPGVGGDCDDLNPALAQEGCYLACCYGSDYFRDFVPV
jgi:hypothetical protein